MTVVESELPDPELFAWGRSGDLLAVVHVPGLDRRVIAAAADAEFTPEEAARIREALGVDLVPQGVERSSR